MTTSLLSEQHARTSRFAKFSRYHRRQRYRAVKRCTAQLSISGKPEGGIRIAGYRLSPFGVSPP
jgi:hypothetical protein